MLYGILKSSTNTGLDSELQCVFSTPLSIFSNQPDYVQDSLNLTRTASSQNVQRWEIETKLSPLNGSSAYLTHSVLNGRHKTFYVRMPQVPNLAYSTATVTVGNNANYSLAIPANSEYMRISGASAMVPGEFFRFPNDSKVYMVVEGGAAGANVKFAPRNRVSVSSGATLVLGGKVTMNASYDVDVAVGIVYSDGVLSDPGTIKLVERI